MHPKINCFYSSSFCLLPSPLFSFDSIEVVLYAKTFPLQEDSFYSLGHFIQIYLRLFLILTCPPPPLAQEISTINFSSPFYHPSVAVSLFSFPLF